MSCLRSCVRTLLAIAFVLGSFISAARAADTGSITGTVLDPLGGAVANATVTLLREGQPVQETHSGGHGEFAFEGLPEARYRLQARADGFQVRLTDPAFLGAGARLSVQVSLPLGPLESDVTVSAAATELLPSQIGAPVTVFDAGTLAAIGKPAVLDALRLVPGNSLVQTGARGGSTSTFVRGGNSNFTKVVLDGVPINDIGGNVDLSAFAMTGVDRIDVLRVANSVIPGTDALAGVVNITTRRGETRLPEVSLSLDGGNLSTDREEVSIGGVARRLDYFSAFSHFGTANEVPNNDFRLKTYAGRAGYAVGHNTELTVTGRWIDKYYGSPNGISLYGVPDDAYSTARLHLIGVGGQTQITDRWVASARVGLSDQRTRFVNPTLSGEDMFGLGFGDTVTIRGANGYSVTGRGALDFGAGDFPTRSARQGVYAQTTYTVASTISVSGGGDFEREQAFGNPDGDPTTTRHNGTVWVEGHAALADRVTATGGVGFAHIEGFANRYSPRVSIAAYLRKPDATGAWNDTRLVFNAGKGVKASSVTAVDKSLYKLLLQTPAGQALASRSGIGPIGPERGRNLDVGVEQGLAGGRVRVRASYFNNEFFDLIEFVSQSVLPSFGIAPDVAAAVAPGAYVNSQSYKAQGLELSADARIGRLRVAGSYTYLDAEVTKSLSSSVAPQFNPLFPDIPIGGFTALVGQRPFRRPANTGTLLVSYTQGPADVTLTGYFAGKSDDSTFIVGTDINFGNSMLLPNKDLVFAYQKIDLSGGYRLHRRVKLYATIENLLDQRYEPAFGFPALPINVRAGVSLTVGGR
jgi:iron complex outermembrane receptor protein/vitamin B12 transporter